MEALGEALIAIFSAFLELLIHLIAAVLGSSFLAKHAKGMLRGLYLLCAIAAFHLFLGLTLPFITNFNDYLLSPIFNRWMMLGSVIVLVLAYATIVAIGISSDVTPEPDAGAGTEEVPIRAPMGLIYASAFIIVFGGFSILTTDHKRKTLKEELCLAATGKISPIWKDRGETALTLAEKYLKRDLHGKLPCNEAN